MTRFAKRNNQNQQVRLASGLQLPFRQRGAFLALASCLSAVFAFAPGVRAQDAATLLDQMQAAEAKTQYSATQVKTTNGRRETARIYRDGLKRRVEWLEPAVRRGDVLVDDGKTVSLYHRADNSLTQTRSSNRPPDYGAGWSAKREGDTFLLQRGAQRLRLDADRKILLSSASAVSSTSLENLSFGNVPDSRFDFSTPRGAKVIKVDGTYFPTLSGARARASWFKISSDTPDGYAFESAVVGDDQVWLRYSNGARRLSIFQQKAGGNDLAPRSVQGGTFWRADGVRFLVTGNSAADVKSFVAALR